jgi:hypothetical protein
MCLNINRDLIMCPQKIQILSYSLSGFSYNVIIFKIFKIFKI